MGIAPHSLAFLVESQQAGVRFDRTLMVGRQNVFGAPTEIEDVLRRAKLLPAGQDPLSLRRGGLPWAEPLFRALGAHRIDSMDASAVEDPTIVHDLNLPVPVELHECFDCVYDGGTLEHVFNYALALRNCMEMVRVGGHLLIEAAANNLMGHGLYQLSPELFFSALSTGNGYAVDTVVAVESGRRWYEVSSPLQLRARVELTNRKPVVLLIRAQRTARVPIFATPPQQSDYAAIWSGGEGSVERPDPLRQLKRVLRRHLPHVADRLQLLLTRWRGRTDRRRASFRNTRAYRKLR